MSYANKVISEARADILAEHPNMAQPWYAAALANTAIQRAAYWLTPPMRRDDFLGKCGFHGDELVAERARRDKLEADYERR
jgi:hypothetical protein